MDIQDLELAAAAKDDELLAVEDALVKLEVEDRDLAELVKLRFFAGFTNQEIAQIYSISESTVERRWAFVRAWLHRELRG